MILININLKIREKCIMKKWNGELPKVSGSASNILDVSGLTK